MYDVNIIIRDHTAFVIRESIQLPEIPRKGEFLESQLLDSKYGYNHIDFEVTKITRRYNDNMSELDYIDIELLAI